VTRAAVEDLVIELFARPWIPAVALGTWLLASVGVAVYAARTVKDLIELEDLEVS
jgi:hypothetical protein